MTTLDFGRRRRQAILAVLAAGFLLPFANKAVHIDDTMFLQAARHIQDHPLDFYGFDVNWYGYQRPMAATNKNPPGVSFYIALATQMLGWSEVGLHLAFLLPAIAVVLGTYALAERLCRSPLAAALSVLAMPGVLASSTTLMSDVPMLALWVWAAALWVRGLDEQRPAILLSAAGLAGLALWTEYFAASWIPLIFAYSVVRERRIGRWAFFLLIPVAFLATYQALVYVQYEQNLLADLFGYTAAARARAGLPWLDRGLIGLFFLGGCLLTPLFFVPWLGSRRAALGFVGVVVLGAIGLAAWGPIVAQREVQGGLSRWSLALQGALFAGTGISALALALRDGWRSPDAESVLLGLWVVGVFVFAAFLNWTINARAVLPAAPAVAILLWRQLERRGYAASSAAPLRLVAPLILAFGIALAVTWGDYRFAETARTAAEELSHRYAWKGGTLWFQGGWGFQYYMERQGGRRIVTGKSRLKASDILISPLNNSNLIATFPRDRIKIVERVSYPGARWVGILSKPLAAGFYTAIWGPLPYAFGPALPEVYVVLRANKEWDAR